MMPRIWLCNPPGFQTSIGRFDTLVVGYYDRKRLMAAGKVRAGLRPFGQARARGDNKTAANVLNALLN